MQKAIVLGQKNNCSYKLAVSYEICGDVWVNLLPGNNIYILSWEQKVQYNSKIFNGQTFGKKCCGPFICLTNW